MNEGDVLRTLSHAYQYLNDLDAQRIIAGMYWQEHLVCGNHHELCGRCEELCRAGVISG